MKASIYSKALLIGHAELQVGDESMGHVYGELVPTNDYYEYIQKYVWKFWSTNKPDYDGLDSLGFKVQLENGLILEPYGGITIDDIEEVQDEPIQ